MTFIRGCLSLALFSVLASPVANANNDWWFDVEVIAFKRNQALTELEEQFTLAESLLVNQADVDVISNAIYPDISWLKQGLATCGVDSNAPPDFPEEYRIHIPDSDVDFLSLPPLPEPEALDDAAALSSDTFNEVAYGESSFGENPTDAHAFEDSTLDDSASNEITSFDNETRESGSDNTLTSEPTYTAKNNAELHDEPDEVTNTLGTAEQSAYIEQNGELEQTEDFATSNDAYTSEPAQDELLTQQSTNIELTDAQSTNDMGEFVEFAVNENGANDANEASTASEETESELEPEVEETSPPSDETIASYWLSFFGLAFEQVFFEPASSVVSSDESDEVATNTPSPNIALPEDAGAAEYTNRYTVPAFSYCEQPKPWLNIAYTNNGAVWQKDTVDNSLPIPKQLPIIIEGFDFRRAASPHLLSSDQHALTSISRQIRSSRELERMFHIAWRQPVLFGKDNAFNVHLYGGKNYASEFDIDGFMRPADSESNSALESELEMNIPADSLNALDELTQTLHGQSSDSASISNNDSANQTAQTEPDFFAQLDNRITNPKAIPFSDINPLEKRSSDEEAINADALGGRVPPIWEIDGRMKVFLKYINRVPYLHIDSELFYRQPVPSEYFTNSTFGDAAITSDINADIGSQNAPVPASEAMLAATENLTEDNPSNQAVEYKLASIPLAEQRRVISTQLHYFDHPLFGFIVQIRRYHRPADEESSE